MTNRDFAISIRLALHDLGRDTKQKLPEKKDDLAAMLKGLRQEQIARKAAA